MSLLPTQTAWRDQVRDRVRWGIMAPCDHFVHFYENDAALLDPLAGFTAGGLEAGETVVTLASAGHLYDLHERLRSRGLNLNKARKHGCYLPMSAEVALDEFLVNGWPDEALFEEYVRGIISSALASGRRLRIYSELMAVTWEQGLTDATLRLEQLWHDRCARPGVTVFCAYPSAIFAGDMGESVRGLCKAHSRVMP